MRSLSDVFFQQFWGRLLTFFLDWKCFIHVNDLFEFKLRGKAPLYKIIVNLSKYVHNFRNTYLIKEWKRVKLCET